MKADLCEHGDDERAFTDVWTTAEIAFAISCGYRLLHLWELFVYRRCDYIFRDFYTRLARIKIKSEGFPDGLAEAKRAQKDVYVARLNRQMPGLNLSVGDIVRNEPMRQFAKGEAESMQSVPRRERESISCRTFQCRSGEAFARPH